MKKITAGFVRVGILLIALFFVMHNVPVVSASAGGLDYATLTGPNEITVTYEHVLDHNDKDSYSNLGLGLAGRTITAGVPTIDGKGIVLTFDGFPVPPNTTGSIDIANTVTWAGGNFSGETKWPVDDGQAPTLGAVTLKYDVDHSNSLTAGDVLEFSFSEPIDKSTITAANVDARLGVSGGHSFGTQGAGMDINWNESGTVLVVYLGSNATVSSIDAVSPNSLVKDLAGNSIDVPGPIALPTNKPASRTLYFNGAVDNDWSVLGNWWDDASFTNPAESLPTPYDDVVLSATVSANGAGDDTVYVHNLSINGGVGGDLSNFIGIVLPLSVSGTATFSSFSILAGSLVGDAVFQDGSVAGVPYNNELSISSAYITGNVTFSAPNTANYGIINGNVTFHGEYGNAGLVIGDVEFNDGTSNPGTVIGHVAFRDHSVNGSFGAGIIQGNVDVYAPSNNPLDSAENVTGTITYHGYDLSFPGGDGTIGHPYQIETCSQLEDVSQSLGAYYELNNNIDCSDTVNWDTGAGFTPIGDEVAPFAGHFDGKGYVIKNLYINRPLAQDVGLFGVKGSDGDVFNLGLQDMNITGGGVVGGLAGLNYGTVMKSYASGTVTGGEIVGGLVGQNSGDGDIQESYMRGTVTGTHTVGGLVGKMGGIIRHGYAVATLSGGTSGFIGGLTGEAGSVVKDSFWDKEVGGSVGTQGTGKTTAEMKDLLTFTTGFTEMSWDFSNTWNIDSEINNGYPHLIVFDHPILTEIKAIPAKVHNTKVTYDFSVANVNGEAQYLSEECGSDSQVSFTDMTENPGAQRMTIGNLKPGVTYHCSFQVQTPTGNSNELTVGPFTLVKNTSAGGYASASYLNAAGIKIKNLISSSEKAPVATSDSPKRSTVIVPAAPVTVVPSLGEKGLCSLDQQLTQNLRAPSRNGVYNSYTKAIVTQANILQAHLNRLGFNSGATDGILGPISGGAIKRLQTFLGTTADGYIGPITRNLINNSCGTK